MPRPRVLRLLLALALIVAGALIWWVRAEPTRQATASSDPGERGARGSESGRAGDARRAATRTPEDPLPDPDPPAGLSALDDRLRALFPADDPAWAWSRVDLDALREEMPDNAFWRLAAPTDDPELIAEREATRERWNRDYGKVLSNTGTEQEVRDYYAEQRRISEDYVAFTSALLERYGELLPERDRGLVELARELHRARLEEMPSRLSEALERRAAHARARAAWLADEAAFATEPARSGSDGEEGRRSPTGSAEAN